MSESSQPVWLAGSYRCWFVKKYCWLVCMREKYCSDWKFTIVYDKPQPSKQSVTLCEGHTHGLDLIGLHTTARNESRWHNRITSICLIPSPARYHKGGVGLSFQDGRRQTCGWKKGGRKVAEDPRTAAVEVKNPHSVSKLDGISGQVEYWRIGR
jgi:hypothetical protein